MRSHISIFAGVAALLLRCGVADAEIHAGLAAYPLKKGSEILVVHTPSAPAEDCMYELRGALDKSSVETGGGVLLSTHSAQGAPTALTAKMPKLARIGASRAKFYLLGKIICGSESTSSPVVKLSVQRRSEGTLLSRKKWLNILGKRLTPLRAGLERVFPEAPVEQPVDLQTPDDGTGRLFVVEKGGTIKVLEPGSSGAGAVIFLDLRPLVSKHQAHGLIGLAFHPKFKTNGYFYVHYVDHASDSQIVRYEVSAGNPNAADPDTSFTILTVALSAGNHRGGGLVFGPDGYLYLGMGDGSSSGDLAGTAQNTETLLGKMLRIDVNETADDKNYRIPPDNPFAGTGLGREEIFAFGFRNPWRFSFDPDTGRLFLGDVGQDNWEEIDLVLPGRNYGWNVLEGTHCYPPGGPCVNAGEFDLPLFHYAHALGNSVTGGYVYRGKKLPRFKGRYIFGDFISGRLFGAQLDGVKTPVFFELADTDHLIPSFGLDRAGEIYLTSFVEGAIYRLIGG